MKNFFRTEDMFKDFMDDVKFKIRDNLIIKKKFSEKRAECWWSQGLSLRDIARFFKKSHERMQQIIE